MQRNVEKNLKEWAENKDRFPLIVRGARQVGKSYTIEHFGKKYFDDVIVCNFEYQPKLKECFSSLDPFEIVNRLQLFIGKRISGNVLLFLDEIQECPQAITALRYFKEKMPQLAVIVAGSLLEFALQRDDFKMPVGRVTFLYMYPLTFEEFLLAGGHGFLLDYMAGCSITQGIETTAHEKLMALLRIYLIIGGMPKVVNTYFETQDIMTAYALQAELVQAFRADFGKYAKRSQFEMLEKVFDCAPRLVGQRVKYVTIDKETRSQYLKDAIALLAHAGMVESVYHSSASGLPLSAQINEQRFKLLFLDVGLMQYICDSQKLAISEEDIMQLNRGAIAEQYIGQELRALSPCNDRTRLFFWCREKQNSMAEVDYLFQHNGKIFPIEVKAGKEGTLKSLRLFVDEKGINFGIRFSQEKLHFGEKLLSIPLYMTSQLHRLIDEANLGNGG